MTKKYTVKLFYEKTFWRAELSDPDFCFSIKSESHELDDILKMAGDAVKNNVNSNCNLKYDHVEIDYKIIKYDIDVIFHPIPGILPYSKEADPHQRKCEQCGNYEIYGNFIFDLCPSCILEMELFWLEISFGHSNSKHYKKAMRLVKKLPMFNSDEERPTLIFDRVEQYTDFKHEISAIIRLASNWKSFSMTLNGETLHVHQLGAISYAASRKGLPCPQNTKNAPMVATAPT